MGKGKKSKTTVGTDNIVKPTAVAVNQVLNKTQEDDDNARREQVEETLRKSLVEMELKSNLDLDLAVLEKFAYDGSSSSSASSMTDLNMKFDSLLSNSESDATSSDKNSLLLAEGVERLKAHCRAQIAEIVSLEENRLSVTLPECQKLVVEKHNRLQSIRLTKQEAGIQKEMSAKLKEMCSCLQKSVKASTDERARLISADHLHMQTVKAKFQATVDDITSKLTIEEGQQALQAAENDTLREKMHNFQTQAAEREQHYEKAIKEKQTETERVEQGLTALEQACTAEAERSETLKQNLLQLVMTDGEMKNQVKLYSQKFEQFQDAMSKSGAMFKQFDERGKLMKQLIKKLQAEKAQLIQSTKEAEKVLARHKALQPRLAEMENERRNKEAKCRRLQVEVKELREQVKAIGRAASVACGDCGVDGAKSEENGSVVVTSATAGSVPVASAVAGAIHPDKARADGIAVVDELTSSITATGFSVSRGGSRTSSPAAAGSGITAPTSSSSSSGARGSSGIAGSDEHTTVGDDEVK